MQGFVDEGASPPLRELRALLVSLEARDTLPTLEWCETHRAKLRKIGSPLEGLLRVRAFAHLVAEGEHIGAVAYARKHFPSVAQDQPGARCECRTRWLSRSLGCAHPAPASATPAALVDRWVCDSMPP